jgi:hypothetical protein
MVSNPHKKFVLIAVAAMVAALAGVAGFNALIDPLGAYPGVHLEVFEHLRYLRHDRVAKAEMARRGDWEVIVLGSSRAKAGIPAAHPHLATNRTCNLSVDAIRFSELASIFDYARKQNPLKEVVLCLDFYMFSKGPVWLLDFPESRFNPAFDVFLYHCKRLLAEESVRGSWEVLKQRVKGFEPPMQSRLGYFEAKMDEGTVQREVFDRTLRLMGAGYSTQRVDDRHMEKLRGLLRVCRDENIRLNIAIVPVHALDVELLYAGDRWAEFEGWKRHLAQILAAEGVEGRFALWDFTGYAGPPAEAVPRAGDSLTRMDYYFENSHFTPRLGWQLMDALSGVPTNGFGVKITCVNIERHLAKILEDRAEYARSNPEEVEWVARIMAEVGQKAKPLQLGAK